MLSSGCVEKSLCLNSGTERLAIFKVKLWLGLHVLKSFRKQEKKIPLTLVVAEQVPVVLLPEVIIQVPGSRLSQEREFLGKVSG